MFFNNEELISIYYITQLDTISFSGQYTKENYCLEIIKNYNIGQLMFGKHRLIDTIMKKLHFFDIDYMEYCDFIYEIRELLTLNINNDSAVLPYYNQRIEWLYEMSTEDHKLLFKIIVKPQVNILNFINYPIFGNKGEK